MGIQIVSYSNSYQRRQYTDHLAMIRNICTAIPSLDRGDTTDRRMGLDLEEPYNNPACFCQSLLTIVVQQNEISRLKRARC